MSKYQWTIVFDAEDDGDADAQVNDAITFFTSIHSDDLIELEDDE